MKEASPFRAAAATQYLLSLDEVEGWLSVDTALVFIELCREQVRLGLAPGMAEIGVHHGKSFLALAASAEPHDTLFAIDVFERQDLNIDFSGCGHRDTFLHNVARFFPDVEPTLIAGSSEDLLGHEAAHGLSNLRFMSIDGGHTASLTLNDLQVADASLAPAGLCALDDILSSHWTGVLTGLFRYFETGGQLVPFCLVPNKLLLCRREFVETYRRFMNTTFAYARERQDLEFGPSIIDVFGATWSPESRLFPRQPANDLAGTGRPGPASGQPNVGMETFAASIQQPDQQTIRLQEAEALLAKMRASTSWRITEPLRGVTRFMRSKLHPGANT